jgi:hypothetical protein
MALTRILGVHTYKSSSGGVSYYFDIVVDEQGLVSVRNIITPTGILRDSTTSLPQSVLDDMGTAKSLTEDLLTETTIDNGNIVFSGDTSRPVVFGTAMNNTNYRVAYTTPDGTVLTTEDKTINGFNAVAAVAYGTVAVPITVAYAVLEKTSGTSTTGGSLNFTDADAGSKSISFATAFNSDDYRVILSPVGFFPVEISAQTKTGFTVTLGITLGAGEDVDVGYDVFV